MVVSSELVSSALAKLSARLKDEKSRLAVLVTVLAGLVRARFCAVAASCSEWSGMLIAGVALEVPGVCSLMTLGEGSC
jgi:hypothetical protein